MSLPSPANDYEAPSQDADLNAAFWNAALKSVGARLRACEAIRAEFQALIDAGTSQALTMIAENVAPQLAQLALDIQAAQQAVDLLLAGQIPANDVTESTTRVFVTPAQKAAIGTHTTAIAANTAAIIAADDNAISYALALG